MHTLLSDLSTLKQQILLAANTFKANADTDKNYEGLQPFEWPSLSVTTENDEYRNFLLKHTLTDNESRLLLSISLSRYVFDGMWKPLFFEGNPFSLQIEHDVALPTFNTFLMLAAGAELNKRHRLLENFGSAHLLSRLHVVENEYRENDSDPLNCRLRIGAGFRDLLLHNQHTRPTFSPDFPATELTSTLEWGDLILEPPALAKLEEIFIWHKYRGVLEQNQELIRHFRPGYRALFTGPSGTGKTLAATLLGKRLSQPVYRVDLSMLISKYVGETSKNLSRIFDLAENKGWVLFFDEGDALFGKRIDTSQTENKNNTYANQEIAFLLQRIERFNGLVIVATNLPKNLDSAFSRRFESLVTFKTPSAEFMAEIWLRFWPPHIEKPAAASLLGLLRENPLPLASMFNVLQRISLNAHAHQKNTFTVPELRIYVMDEYMK
jgi:hypothetical protein